MNSLNDQNLKVHYVYSDGDDDDDDNDAKNVNHVMTA
jgi:hypothetical protein